MYAKLILKPTSVIKADLGLQPDGHIQAFFTSTCAKHMDDYVPLRDGDLSSYKLEGKDKIVYDTPYARYMYYGEVMGPNIPIKDDNGNIVRWFSPKKKKKYLTGKAIDYSASVEKGHKHAGPKWDERMWSAEKDIVTREVQREFDRGGKA